MQIFERGDCVRNAKAFSDFKLQYVKKLNALDCEMERVLDIFADLVKALYPTMSFSY